MSFGMMWMGPAPDRLNGARCFRTCEQRLRGKVVALAGGSIVFALLDGSGERNVRFDIGSTMDIALHLLLYSQSDCALRVRAGVAECKRATVEVLDVVDIEEVRGGTWEKALAEMRKALDELSGAYPGCQLRVDVRDPSAPSGAPGRA